MSIAHHSILLYTHDISTVDIVEISAEDEVQDTEFETFGVDDAEQLIRNAHIRPATHNTQLCVIRTPFISLEAQNALLKVFEEPPVSTRFLLVVPKDFVVIDTLLSRCEIIEANNSTSENESFIDFLAASYRDRLTLIDQAQKKKNAHWQRDIKKGLIEYLKTHTKDIKELEYVARLLLTRGASNKFLLEHAALILPSRTNG